MWCTFYITIYHAFMGCFVLSCSTATNKREWTSKFSGVKLVQITVGLQRTIILENKNFVNITFSLKTSSTTENLLSLFCFYYLLCFKKEEFGRPAWKKYYQWLSVAFLESSCQLWKPGDFFFFFNIYRRNNAAPAKISLGKLALDYSASLVYL